MVTRIIAEPRPSRAQQLQSVVENRRRVMAEENLARRLASPAAVNSGAPNNYIHDQNMRSRRSIIDVQSASTNEQPGGSKRKIRNKKSKKNRKRKSRKGKSRKGKSRKGKSRKNKKSTRRRN
jgi:hypothetical protein